MQPQAVKMKSQRVDGAIKNRGDRITLSASRSDSRAAQSGLSLLEMLVALAIAAVVMTIFLQSMTQQARTNDRIRDAAGGALSLAIGERQFRTVINGLTPAWQEDEAGRFAGGARRLTGLTRSPLAGSQEFRVAAFELAATEEASELRYIDGSNVMTIATLPAGARFAYLGDSGAWAGAWSSNGAPQRALPRAVKLEAGDVAWVARTGRDIQLLKPFEDPFGAGADRNE